MRIGIDLGGTKIAIIALGDDGSALFERRTATPRGDYDATLATIASLVAAAEAATNTRASIGIGMPGSLSPRSGLVQNANSTWLNGRPLGKDVEALLGREVRLANDANCFALSEAVDGAGRDHRTMFGVIIGTGCGGGVVFDRQLIDGPRGIGGEWGHNPLPWMSAEEHPGRACWCGLNGCLETFLSGPGLALDHRHCTGHELTAEQIASCAREGNAAAEATLTRHASRLARGLAVIVNILDPDVIVLGGGLSNMPHLYAQVPELMAPYIFADDKRVRVVPPRFGDASGVRGAARLWQQGSCR